MANDKTKKTRKKRVWEVLPETERLAAEKLINESIIQEYRAEAFEDSEIGISDLADYFLSAESGTKNILPKEKRRYVLYLRKSTDDEAKQIRSLEDQRAECLELASRQGIRIRDEDILEESASAKISNNRPIYNEMIKGFQTGKYHGLISWSPDRISRNMKEAGEVIEMIDQEDIQDLQFRTYQFENSPNGKMLLGILFATSKQYSDKLSVDVSRGITGNITDGKYNGVIKKGYFVDASTGYFIPDGYNWDVLRAAVDMRLYQGKNNVDVAKFLTDAKLSIRKNQDEEYKLVRVDKQMVGDMFSDPFYFGLYRYGNHQANIVDLYDFVPLITPDEYIALNAEVANDFGKEGAKVKRSQRLDYGLLRNKVICDYCDTDMQFQNQQLKRGKNAGRWIVSFYCRNKECQRYKTEENKANGVVLKKSIRANYVMSAIEWQLRHCTVKSKKAYRLHIDKVENQLAQERAITKRKIQEAKTSMRENEKRYMRYQDFQVEKPELYEKHHYGKLEHHQQLAALAEEAVETNQEKLKKLETALPTEQEFYELIDVHLLGLLKEDDILKLDAICKELVLNLRAGNDSIPVIKLNPPYDLMVDLSKISTGRGCQTRTGDLCVPNAAR